MKTIILSMILFIYVPLYSFDNWSTTDYVLQTSVLTLTTIDLVQTYTFLYKEPYVSRNHSEMNPLMGLHPTKKRFFFVGGCWMLFHTALSYILPSGYRRTWQITYLYFETIIIHHNYKCGVRIKF